MRVAAIDIGTNTVLLLVAERAEGQAVAIAEHATITRLGEGVDRTRRLSEAAIGRTVECLESYARIVRELGAERVSLVGTSAMRDAGGGEELRSRIRDLFGTEPRVLSGAEEARLTFRGALSGLGAAGLRTNLLDGSAGDADVAVFDIGGGSTEVILGRIENGVPRETFGKSYDLGSVRLTERHVAHDPPSEEELELLAVAARDAIRDVPLATIPTQPVGVAGTMTTLAAVSLGLVPYDGSRVHGHVMQVDELRRVVGHLASLRLEARRLVPGMEPKRADVIVAGGIIALAILGHWSSSEVRISDRGVRWGIAEELLVGSASG
jgi:exopolyphosphatase / guanosine-5'-triphosphate,3'-diphosphate pyrophosphatase